MFTVRLPREEEVKSTLWAVLPLRLRVPAEVMAPLARVILPPAVRPLTPATSVPDESCRVPATVIGELCVRVCPELKLTVRLLKLTLEEIVVLLPVTTKVLEALV